MGVMELLAQSSSPQGGLPAWWPIAAVLIPVVITIIVAFIQMSSAVKVAKIQSSGFPAATPPADAIAEQVIKVLGAELDKRIGPERMAEAQSAHDKGKRDSEEATKELLEAHQRVIGELQAQLAARDREPDGQKPEALAAAKLYNAGFDAQTERNLGEAIGLYSAAILLDPSYAKAYYNRGNAKYDLGDKRGAIEDYDQAIHYNPNDALACFNCGNAKFDLGDLKGAIADYNESIRLDPTFQHSYYNRGNAKVAMGDREAALEDYAKAAEVDPKYAAAYYNTACQNAKLGHAEESLAALQVAVNLEPGWAKQAMADPDFDLINESPGFKAIVE